MRAPSEARIRALTILAMDGGPLTCQVFASRMWPEAGRGGVQKAGQFLGSLRTDGLVTWNWQTRTYAISRMGQLALQANYVAQRQGLTWDAAMQSLGVQTHG